MFENATEACEFIQLSNLSLLLRLTESCTDENAIRLAEDAPTKMRYVTALKTVKATQVRNKETFSKITPARASYDFDNSPISRIRRACAEEGFEPTPGGSIELLDAAYTLGAQGFAALEETLWKDETGHPQGKVGTNTNQSLSGTSLHLQLIRCSKLNSVAS